MKHNIEEEAQTNLDQVDVFMVRWITIMFGMLILCSLLWWVFPDWGLPSGLMVGAIAIPPIIFFRHELVDMSSKWIWYIKGKKPKESIEE